MKSKIIFGFHAVTARIRHDASSLEEIYVDKHRLDRRMKEFLDTAKANGIHTIKVDSLRLSNIVGTHRHQGVVAKSGKVPSLENNLDAVLDAVVGPPLLLVLDGVTDPRNLGACLRVADGVGAHAVIAPKDRAVGLNAAAAKTASGAAETVPYITVTNLARTLREMKDRGICIIGTEKKSEKSLYGAALTSPVSIVMGSEGEGMRRLTRDHCDVLVGIPMLGAVNSLNTSVAAGVFLYEAHRQRILNP